MPGDIHILDIAVIMSLQFLVGQFFWEGVSMCLSSHIDHIPDWQEWSLSFRLLPFESPTLLWSSFGNIVVAPQVSQDCPSQCQHCRFLCVLQRLNLCRFSLKENLFDILVRWLLKNYLIQIKISLSYLLTWLTYFTTLPQVLWATEGEMLLGDNGVVVLDVGVGCVYYRFMYNSWHLLGCMWTSHDVRTSLHVVRS